MSKLSLYHLFRYSVYVCLRDRCQTIRIVQPQIQFRIVFVSIFRTNIQLMLLCQCSVWIVNEPDLSRHGGTMLLTGHFISRTHSLVCNWQNGSEKKKTNIRPRLLKVSVVNELFALSCNRGMELINSNSILQEGYWFLLDQTTLCIRIRIHFKSISKTLYIKFIILENYFEKKEIYL